MENRNRKALLDQLEWFADEIDAQAELLREIDENVFTTRSHEKGDSLRDVYLELLRTENEWKSVLGLLTSTDSGQGNNSGAAPFSEYADAASLRHQGEGKLSSRSTVDLMREISSARRAMVSLLRSPDGPGTHPGDLDGLLYEHTLQDAVWLRKLGEMVHERRSILFMKEPRGPKR